MRIVLITNIPSPYRVLLFDELAKKYNNKFWVFYCAKIEPNRKWQIPILNHYNIFLKSGLLKIGEKHVYLNLDIWKQLKIINPDIVITGGFNPTMLIACMYTKLFKKKHIITTDAWEKTEAGLSILHKVIRKIVYKYADAFLPVSKKGKTNFLRYGVTKNKIFKCPYAIDVENYRIFSKSKKEFDLMFAGQFINRKMPYFFCDILGEIRKTKKNIKALIVGDGPLKYNIIERLNNLNVEFEYPGFIQPKYIPKYFASSKIFLFPTLADSWGIVANEACAAGTPVITCYNAGVAAELIIHNYNGFILPLDVDIWVRHIIELLDNKKLYRELSHNCLNQIEKYSVKRSAEGFFKAINSIQF